MNVLQKNYVVFFYSFTIIVLYLTMKFLMGREILTTSNHSKITMFRFLLLYLFNQPILKT